VPAGGSAGHRSPAETKYEAHCKGLEKYRFAAWRPNFPQETVRFFVRDDLVALERLCIGARAQSQSACCGQLHDRSRAQGLKLCPEGETDFVKSWYKCSADFRRRRS